MNTISGTALTALLLAGVSSAAAQERLGSRHQPGEIFRDCPTCPQMVVVPAGSFMMGSPASEEGSDEHERPQHRVTIGEPFAVGIYEVTFAEWDACVRDGGCGGHSPDDEGWGRGPRPVMNVGWERPGVDGGLLERELFGGAGRWPDVATGRLFRACVARRLLWPLPKVPTLGVSQPACGRARLLHRIPCRPDHRLRPPARHGCFHRLCLLTRPALDVGSAIDGRVRSGRVGSAAPGSSAKSGASLTLQCMVNMTFSNVCVTVWLVERSGPARMLRRSMSRFSKGLSFSGSVGSQVKWGCSST